MWKKHKYHCYVVINSNLKDKMGQRFTKLNNHVPWLSFISWRKGQSTDLYFCLQNPTDEISNCYFPMSWQFVINAFCC